MADNQEKKYWKHFFDQGSSINWVGCHEENEEEDSNGVRRKSGTQGDVAIFLLRTQLNLVKCPSNDTNLAILLVKLLSVTSLLRSDFKEEFPL